MFVDTVSLELSAGRGGDGVIAWRREKYIPKGGPSGGDGGHGGSVILIADDQIPSLEHLRNRRIIKAENGRPGEANHRTGRNGKDRLIPVPLGTLLKDAKTGEILCDFTEHGQKLNVCRGGKGGKGNNRFKTPTHQAPYVCTPGLPGEECNLDLELKLIADIGLVGMPNAGKSTLISSLTYIRVKIAPYPFTTLRPNLGIMRLDSGQKLLIADIPGLIENASKDRGLGISFLKHVERTSILIFMIELAPHQDRDPYTEFQMLRNELQAYNPSLLEKPFLVCLNKIDQEETKELADSFRKVYPYDPSNLFEISASVGINLDSLKKAIQAIAPQKTVAKQDQVEETPSGPEENSFLFST